MAGELAAPCRVTTARTVMLSHTKGSNRSRHGHACRGHLSATYTAWTSMKSRCTNPKVERYGSYGGRGITFDPRWAVFENFLADMGEKPVGYTLERLHVNRNYWRGNCIWLPAELQMKNQTKTRLITWRFRTMCMADWARELGIHGDTLKDRLYSGWSVERAFTTPVRLKSNG